MEALKDGALQGAKELTKVHLCSLIGIKRLLNYSMSEVIDYLEY